MRGYLLAPSRKLQYKIALGDAAVVAVSTMILWAERLDHVQSLSWATILMAFSISLQMFVMYVLDLYEHNACSNRLSCISRLILSSLVQAAVVSLFLYVFIGRETAAGFSFPFGCLFLNSGLLVAWRLAVPAFTRNQRTRKLGLVGPGETLLPFLSELTAIPGNGFSVEAVCFTDGCKAWPESEDHGFRCYSGVDELIESSVYETLICDCNACHFSDHNLLNIVDRMFDGRQVYDFNTWYEEVTGRAPLSYMDNCWFLRSREFKGKASIFYLRLKRLIDIFGGLFALLIASPVLIAVSILIKRESDGPVLFVQERAGLNLKPFKCYKFRTMIDNAEEGTGPVWASENDPRVTRVGRFLRKMRLDELPQLWNIVRGDMTFVGPRPIRRHFIDILSQSIPFYVLRASVKPGLTGWAQVNLVEARAQERQLEKFQYDLFYIRNMSFMLDMLIFLKTAKIVIKGTGL